jgi:intracellular sulfur oxidation DsrE/DsrF family protein
MVETAPDAPAPPEPEPANAVNVTVAIAPDVVAPATPEPAKATTETVAIGPDVAAPPIPAPANAEIVMVETAPDVAAVPDPEPANAVNVMVAIAPVAVAFLISNDEIEAVDNGKWPSMESPQLCQGNVNFILCHQSGVSHGVQTRNQSRAFQINRTVGKQPIIPKTNCRILRRRRNNRQLCCFAEPVKEIQRVNQSWFRRFNP